MAAPPYCLLYALQVFALSLGCCSLDRVGTVLHQCSAQAGVRVETAKPSSQLPVCGGLQHLKVDLLLAGNCSQRAGLGLSFLDLSVWNSGS